MLSLTLSMAAFSLASSISPGPVNIVALSAGMGHGFVAALRHVVGATVGFTVLLILIGVGIHSLGEQLPLLLEGLRWAGAAFLLYMAVRLAWDRGDIALATAERAPSAWVGAVMQWVNPKAWMASAAGMALFTTDRGLGGILAFAAIFFVLCLGSIACWAYAGACLGRLVRQPAHIRRLNRLMAVALVLSAGSLIWQ